MKYCTNCGSTMQEGADVCLSCGKSFIKSTASVNDTGGFGWGLLGFCFPLVGLILFLVWSTDRPLNAKAAGLGALISVVASVLFYVLFIVLVIVIEAL